MFIKLLFLAEIIIMIVASAILSKTAVVRNPNYTPETKSKIPKAKNPKSEIFVNICVIFSLLMGLADIIGIIQTDEVDGGFIVIGIVLLLEKVCHIVRTKIQSGTIRFFSKMLVITALIELIVFQLPSYRIFFGDYKNTLLFMPQGTVTSDNIIIDPLNGNMKVCGQATSSIEFQNIDRKIGTVKINSSCLNEYPNRLYVGIDTTDETSVTYRPAIIKGEIVQGNKSTEYITFLLSGKTDKLKFHFTAENDNNIFNISSIEINAPIPFEISLLRMLIILITSTFVYAVIFSAFFNREYKHNKAFCLISTGLITALALFVAVSMTITKSSVDVDDSFTKSTENQISKELVLAFENKQVSLLTEPTEDLLSLDNPYDRGLRDATGVWSEWDHVLYNGKYYSYYGIAPVILLFLPYHMITGKFLPSDIAVIIFSIIGIIFLSLTYNAFIKKWFSRIPTGCYLAGLLIIMTACGIWFSTGRPIFYEIAISSGFAFITLGAYFLISSNTISKGKISLPKVTLASLFLAIAVLCRPTLAVYSICACVFYVMGFKKSAEFIDADGIIHNDKKHSIKYVVCALLPFVVLGSVQMWYNYARFDSPLDFGIQYSLTINDFTNAECHLIYVLIGIFAYLFQFPTIKADYPYVNTWFTYFHSNGFYYKDWGQTSGIIWLALPVFGYLLSGKALKKLPDRSSRLRAVATIGLPCIIMPFIIICSIWESGYAVRYMADFSWEIIIGAFTILFFMYINSKNETLRKLFRYFMAFSVVTTFIVNIPQIFDFAFEEPYFPILTSKFHELIEFWR